MSNVYCCTLNSAKIFFLISASTRQFLLLKFMFPRRHNINTGMFLASLSVAELLLLVVYLPLEFTKDILTQEVQGGEVCKLKEFVKMLTALASVINLAAVSFERYVEIKININLRRCAVSVFSFIIINDHVKYQEAC